MSGRCVRAVKNLTREEARAAVVEEEEREVVEVSALKLAVDVVTDRLKPGVLATLLSTVSASFFATAYD
jgi:hypothetical protein